jgi:hypothetical protein
MPIPSIFFDNPDLQTRTAALKLGSGVAPSAAEFRRLANRQGVEREAARVAAGGASYAPSDPRNGAVPSALLGVRPELPGGGYGPSGPIDVRSYAGSRYSAANMVRPAAPTGPGLLAGVPGAAGTALDPATAEYRAQKQAQDLEQGRLAIQQTTGAIAAQPAQLEHTQAATAATRAETATRATDAAAFKRASSPSVGLAQQIRAGAGFTQLDPNAAGDPMTEYAAAGGSNPQHVAALFREKPFNPAETTLPSGTRVIQTSPKSYIPDPQQERPRRPGSPKDDQPEYSADGKFYRSGPEDKWSPVPASHDKPLNVNEWLMAGRPEGNYKTYREAWQKESGAVPAATPKTPAAAPAAATPGAPAKAAVYRHEDVQAELKRRGLAK